MTPPYRTKNNFRTLVILYYFFRIAKYKIRSGQSHRLGFREIQTLDNSYILERNIVRVASLKENRVL
jgi:hypothetical protein